MNMHEHKNNETDGRPRPPVSGTATNSSLPNDCFNPHPLRVTADATILQNSQLGCCRARVHEIYITCHCFNQVERIS